MTFASLLLLSMGCADSGPQVAPVSGVITIKGKPLAGARINTQPMAPAGETEVGVGSFAVTDDQGRYELELVDPARPGAIVGQHVVRIRLISAKYQAGKEDAPTYVKSPLPPSSGDGSLTLDVPITGTSSANFEF